MEFPVQHAADIELKSESSHNIKKELQTLKYVSEGGIQIKRNLFDTWHHVYEKEITHLSPKEGGLKTLPPEGSPILNLFNLKFDKKVEELVFS